MKMSPAVGSSNRKSTALRGGRRRQKKGSLWVIGRQKTHTARQQGEKTIHVVARKSGDSMDGLE